ncbi:transposase [Botrimarina sp.]|uniref:transposase n=1 Tax=Botrimarina sp. TaxID=2795802 RepID=UPI0032EC0FAA
MRGPAVRLSRELAHAVCEQFQATARQRGWKLFAISVMANHIHLVIAAPHAIRTETLFRDLKGYASKAMNERFGRPASGAWWTRSGSRRRLHDEEALFGAIDYTLNRQRGVLARFDAKVIGSDCPCERPPEPRAQALVANHGTAQSRE